MDNLKTCTKCLCNKSTHDFHKSTKSLDGIRNVCKECRKLEKEEYTSRPEVKERFKKYYQENKESIRSRMNQHYWTLNGQFHNYKRQLEKEA